MRKFKDEELKAREIIGKMIDEYTAYLTEEGKKEEGDPIMLEGITNTGYYANIMVNPADVIPILLRWDYPVFLITGAEIPDGMWKELGDKIGLEAVTSIDI